MELRVLDLERVFRPKLPETVCKLIQLRYLGLRWTYLEEIPLFIGKLLNLITLDLEHTCIRTIPSSIWKWKKLRNLYLNQTYRRKFEGKLSGNSLEILQTLWGVFVDENSPLLYGLNRLQKLRKLKLALQLGREDQERLANLIVKLQQLHCLSLRSVDDIGKLIPLTVINMSKLEKLSSLYLSGDLVGNLCVHQLPNGLTDLTLSASKLREDPMAELEKVPNLESLCLYSDSYIGKRMACTKGGFPKLRVLRFWKLEKLQEWHLEEGAMPNLMELEIRSCMELKVPNGLEHLKTLHQIKLIRMPKKLATEIDAKIIKEL